jgi:tetratricopeptide (TPR) repeat protein
MDPASPAARLSNYRLDRLLGAGGMGSVYLARDLALDRLVAIKFIAADRATDDASRKRRIREARAAAALDHPNICGVHEVIVEPDGRACIVMQYVEGQTLADKLTGGPLDVRMALSIATDVAAALAAAHGQGIIHRDVKPQNIMLTTAHGAKLLDFGLAVHSHVGGAAVTDTTATSLTSPGVLVRTLPYMSPEQVAQRPLDARSDLFSLGAVLFECLTGPRPFTGPSSVEVATLILHEDPPPVSALRPELTEQHDELCRRLLAKHPDDRFHSAEELLGALRVCTPDPHRSHSGSRSGRSTTPITTGARSGSARRSARMLAVTGIHLFRAPRAAGVVALVLIAFTAVALAGRPSAWRRGTSASGTILIGVLPFRNESGSSANDPVVAGLREAVARRLEAVPEVRVLPLRETDTATRDGAKPADLARSLGAAFVVDGALVSSAQGLDVIASLVHPDGNPKPVGRFRYAGNLVDLHRRLTEGLVAALGADASIDAGSAAASLPTEDPEAFAEDAQARAFLERPDVPGNLDHAVRLFKSAIDKDARFALAHAGLAEAYWAQSRETKDPAWPAKAMAANVDALAIDPNQAEVRMSLAVMYSGQGRHKDAVEELNRVKELQPQSDDPYRVLTDVYIAGASWEAAIAAAKEAVRLRPSYWRNHSQLGLAYFRAGKYDDAIPSYERVVQLQPDSARGYQTLGTVLQAAGKNDQALVQYEKAIAIRPSAGTYSNVGTLYFWGGNPANAADAYAKAVVLSPNDPDLHANLGDAYARLGEKTKAAHSYRRAVALVQALLAISANDSQQLAALALYQAKLGQHRAAADAIARAMTLSPADGQVLYVGALVHTLAGDVASGCTVLAEAVKHGASAEEIRNAGELRTLGGCPPYDGIVRAPDKQED